MPSKRVIQAGHILALVFIGLLLAGARTFLGAHPMLSGVMLALVAPVYYVAARVSGHRQFLHPAALLATLAFQLLVYGAGLQFQYQALASLIPIGIMFLGACRGLLKHIEGASLSLYGAINFTIGAFSFWVLLRITTQFATAPLATAAALAGYALYAWFRFIHTEKVSYLLAMVALGSAGFFFLLYRLPDVALGFGAIAGLFIMADLFRRRMLPRLETAAFLGVGAYLIFIALTGSPATQIPLGYLVLAGTWLHLGLVFNRPELPPLVGPHPAPLPRLMPLFGAGILLALAPIVLFRPWGPLSLPVPYLTVFFVMFLAASNELGKQSFSLIGVLLARALAVLARLAAPAAGVFLWWHGFFPSYRVALASLAFAALSLLAAWRRAPNILRRRNLYAYQGAVFATLGYFLAVHRLSLGGIAGILLESGALLVIVVAAIAYALRTRIAATYLTSLYEATAIPAAVACALQVQRGHTSIASALLTGILLIAASLLTFAKIKAPAVVFTLPVVLGLWIYVVASAAGIRAEWLGMPYLVFGLASAAVGYLLNGRNNRWYQLAYFMWFLCTGVSLALFSPMREAGAYAAPLWTVAFLLIARGQSCRRDLPFAIALESLSAVMGLATVVVICLNGLYVATSIALFIYAAFYTWIALRSNVHPYLYPAALCLAAECFFAVLSRGREQRFLAYFFPVAAVMYLIAAILRRRGISRDARPLELAATLGAIVGALLFLTLPFGAHTILGILIGLAYLALYGALTAYSRERVFITAIGLAGAFAFYELLPALPHVTRGNRLAFFVPVSLVLVLLGRRQHRAQDPRGGWGLYAAAIVVTVLASIFAMWPQPADPGASRVVLLIAIAVWPVLLVWTNSEIFIYGATVGLAMLAYHFVQSSTDMFGQHMMAFFLFGTIVVGLVFVAAALRSRMPFRRPTLLVAPRHWYARLVYLVPVGVLGVATFGSWGVSSSSNPHFCGTCHNMGTYFANWKVSKHAAAEVGCASCHYDPGLSGYLRAKAKGTSQLVATLTRTASNRPEAQVSDTTCLRSGCHATTQLARPVMLRSVRFEHGPHLGAMSRGPQLRCTSCHTSVDPNTHFAVDTNACFTCHFPDGAKSAAASCLSCHSLPQGKVAFDHVAAGIKPRNEVCASCHERVVAGAATVEPRDCRHCHVESASRLMASSSADIHRRHVLGQAVNCDWCHGAVRHGALDKQIAMN